MSLIALFKNCYEHFKGKFQKNYIPAQTPKLFAQKKALVLDLDETLVHSEFKENENFQHEAILKVTHRGQEYKVYLKVRPYLNQFLQEASKDYEIFIFTAGYEAYCQEVLSFIDKKKIITDYFARGSCHFIDGICYKDLLLIDRPMEDIIFIDNNPNAFINYQNNGLLIPTFLDSNDDDCLLKLLPFLKYMAKKKDVRPVELNLRNYEDKNGIVDKRMVQYLVISLKLFYYQNRLRKVKQNFKLSQIVLILLLKCPLFIINQVKFNLFSIKDIISFLRVITFDQFQKLLLQYNSIQRSLKDYIVRTGRTR